MYPNNALQVYGHANGEIASEVSLDEWLNFHSITRAECASYLCNARSLTSNLEMGCTTSETLEQLHPYEVWWDVCTAFQQYFTGEQKIHALISDIRPIFKEQPQYGDRAFALDSGAGELPIVYVPCSTFCKPFEILAIAHEFSHAFQIMSSRVFHEGRMPPIPRECCALIGELIYLSFLRKENRNSFSFVSMAWRSNAQLFLKRYSRELIKALSDGACNYSYTWNYPLAMLAAWLVFEENPTYVISVFRSGENAMSDLRRLLDA